MSFSRHFAVAGSRGLSSKKEPKPDLGLFFDFFLNSGDLESLNNPNLTLKCDVKSEKSLSIRLAPFLSFRPKSIISYEIVTALELGKLALRNRT